MRLPLCLVSLPLISAVLSQAFISPPQGLTEIISDKFPGARLSYKEVEGICETSDGVKSYSGYVHLPKDFLPDAADWPEKASGNFFFWYFESRNDPDSSPTAIYIGGGPGYTTFDGSAVFPCYFNSDSNSTSLNEHSWNKNTNMLYIDQPVGTGFSYTSLANGTYNFLEEKFTEVMEEEQLPELNLTFRQATVQSRLNETLTTTSRSSARSLWRFAQVFFNDFPEWQTRNEEIAVWSVSYGGLFAPLFAEYTVRQNAIIRNGSHSLNSATSLNIRTVGVMNALVDARAMARGIPDFLRNNTYDLELVPEDSVDEIVENVKVCYDQADKCRGDVALFDPEGEGKNETLNKICVQATTACIGPVLEFARDSKFWNFDVSANRYVRKPSEYNTAFFNQPWVQSGLGLPLNFTRSSSMNYIQSSFLLGNEETNTIGTGDPARYDTSSLSMLLDNGVNVAMIYGDLDVQCNWMSGENASLEINHRSKDAFAAAGYTDLWTNDSFVGGLVREAGLLSFSRVFQAGHSTGGYQPQTVSAIFNRAMLGYEVATGREKPVGGNPYATHGAMNIRNIKKDLPDPIENLCYVFTPKDKCTEEQLNALLNGTAETRDWVVVSPKGIKEIGGERNGEYNAGGNDTKKGGGKSPGGTVDGNTAARAIVTPGLAIFDGIMAFFAL